MKTDEADDVVRGQVGRRGRRRRADVLDALAQLLESRPLAMIEVQDIAQQAGISRSGFYFYFPTRAAAVAALIEDVQRQLVEVGVDWYKREDLPDDIRVRRGMSATVRFWRKHARLISAMFDAGREDSDVRNTWAKALDALSAGARERIDSDNQFGRPRSAMLAKILVDMTASAMERDVRQIVETGRPLHGLENALVHVWLSSTASHSM